MINMGPVRELAQDCGVFRDEVEGVLVSRLGAQKVRHTREVITELRWTTPAFIYQYVFVQRIICAIFVLEVTR